VRDLTSLLFFIQNFLGIFEGLLEIFLETSESLGSDSSLLSTGLGSLALEGSSSVSLALSIELGSLLSLDLGVGVKSLHENSVLEGILVVLIVNADGSSDLTELGLNLVGVDDSGQIGASHHGSVELVAVLLNTLLSVGTEDLVEGLESILGVDDETTEVTTGGELEEVKSVNRADINTSKVSGSSLEGWVLITVNDKGTLSHDEAGVSHLTGTASGGLGFADSLEVLLGTKLVQSLEQVLGSLNVEGVNNKRKFRNIHNSVTSGEDERSDSGGSQSRGDGVSLLVDIDSLVPLSPDLERSEHSTLTAHVTEGSLTGSAGTGTTNSRNTSDSSTSTPGLGGVLLTGLLEHTMGLSAVLSHVSVHKLDGIISDRGGEDGGHGNVTDDLVGRGAGVNGNNGSGSHIVVF
jgi:hypothetical protein